MNELFGISMDVIMLILVGLFAASVAAFAGIYLSNRIMFRMGFRNVRRRRAQSLLIVAGLMLATVIITAAFGTGDTVSYSVTNLAYENLQRTDLSLHHFRSTAAPSNDADTLREQSYVPESVTAEVEEMFANDPEIAGFMPFIFERVPVTNLRTNLSEPLVFFAGYDAERLGEFGGLKLANGDAADINGLGADEVFVGEELADAIDAHPGDEIEVFAGEQPVTLRVAAIVRDERSSGQLEFGPIQPPNMAAQMSTVQQIVGREGKINSISVVLRGGVRGSLDLSESAAARLEAFANDEVALERVGMEGLTFQVEQNKLDTVEEAETMASGFVAMFVLMGLFSIAAGTMLIFTLFVMLAAERRTEMGIARAVGAQRVNLVQSFVAEGVVYNVLAGVVGVVLGVACAFALVLVGVRYLFGDQLAFIQPHVTWRSLVVSFSLGAVLTFITVVISSYRVSQLNIVAAVRGQSDTGRREGRRPGVRWGWLVAGVPFLVLLPPLGLYWALRKGLGLPWPRVLIPGGFVLAGLFLLLGLSARLAFFYTLGVSLAILTAAAVALNLGRNPRVVWSVAAVVLGLYWLMPNSLERDLVGEMNENLEMFVLSGIMIVVSFTLLIVQNAQLFSRVMRRGKGTKYGAFAVLSGLVALALAAALAMGDRADGLGQLFYLVAVGAAVFAALAFAAVRAPQIAPALKMGVAYPLASRFRTGMTIAMFSLVVFSLTVMGILNASFIGMFESEEGTGGWDVLLVTNPNNPIEALESELTQAPGVDPAAIVATGQVTEFDDNSQEARVPGDADWGAFPIIAADDAFLDAAQMKLEGRAQGYADERAVFDAVRDDPSLAFVDSSVLQEAGVGGNFAVTVDVEIVDERFEPFELEVRDPVSGRQETVTVVGILSGSIPGNILYGVYVNEDAYGQIYGAPEYRSWFARLEPGTDSEQVADAIESALRTKGVEATSIDELVSDMTRDIRGMFSLLQAFMALGLVVGIAALGVIALRSVVERRQQIGMLRAIGYQRSTVALSFMFESGFIALMGILSGVAGATILSWNLVVSGEFSATGEMEFLVPWFEIVIYSTAALLFALLMTWWPSRKASTVAVAEALRYE